MRSSMLRLALLLLLVSVPSYATPITWQASGTVSVVSERGDLYWPGLVAGTPWTFEVTFDPAAPSTSTGTGCNAISVGTTTFGLGGFSYTNSSGQLHTNSLLPEFGCAYNQLDFWPDGAVSFSITGAWTQEPGAWNLNLLPAVMVAHYFDYAALDGSIPIVPNPIGPGGLRFDGFFGGPVGQFSGGPFLPTAVDQSTPVPEPASLTLLGGGLAMLIARRRRMRR